MFVSMIWSSCLLSKHVAVTRDCFHSAAVLETMGRLSIVSSTPASTWKVCLIALDE